MPCTDDCCFDAWLCLDPHVPQGFLHIRGALSAEELSQARLAADDYVEAAASARAGGKPLPADFSGNGKANGKGYGHGFAWARPLERLVFHRAVWPTILELTSGRPRLHGGTLLYDDLSKGGQHAHGTHMHGARDDHATRSGADPAQGWPSVRCEPRADGTMFCDNFVCARRHAGLIAMVSSDSNPAACRLCVFHVTQGVSIPRRRAGERRRSVYAAWVA